MTNEADYMGELLRRLQAQTADGTESVKLLLDAVQQHPGDARPLMLLGAEFMHQGATDRAEAAYAAAVQCAPGFAIARFQLGLLQFTSGRPAMAMVTWAALGELPEGHYLRLFKEALEALAADRLEEACALLARGIAANGENPPLNRDMQMLMDRIAGPRADVAPAAADEPSDGTGHFLLSAYRTRH